MAEKKEMIYSVVFSFPSDSLRLEFKNKNVRNELILRFKEALRTNQPITLTDMGSTIYDIINPRSVNYYALEEYECEQTIIDDEEQE